MFFYISFTLQKIYKKLFTSRYASNYISFQIQILRFETLTISKIKLDLNIIYILFVIQILFEIYFSISLKISKIFVTDLNRIRSVLNIELAVYFESTFSKHNKR